MKDTYKTIEKASEEVLFKDRNSKFYGYAFPVHSEEAIKEYIDHLKKQHHSARHWCYAWQLGTQEIRFRANDDGEPNNSAGQPIYGQIQSYEVTNILIVVVRYFGGTKLGVGGLINAYRSAAQLALDNSDIVEKTIDAQFELTFQYKDMNKIMRLLKEESASILSQQMEMHCNMVIAIRMKERERLIKRLENLFEIDWKELST